MLQFQPAKAKISFIMQSVLLLISSLCNFLLTSGNQFDMAEGHTHLSLALGPYMLFNW